MRNITSLSMLAARQLVWKLCLLLLAMGTSELLLCHRALLEAMADADSYYSFSFSSLLVQGYTAWVFRAAFVLLVGVVCSQGCCFSGSRMDDTLRRLRMGEGGASAVFAVMHAVCFVVLWAFQLALVFGIWRLWVRQSPWSGGENLELFVELWRDGFLHGLFPLTDWSRHVRNGLWILSLSITTVCFGWLQRRGKITPIPLILALVGLSLQGQEVSEIYTDLSISAIWLGLTAFVFYQMWEVYHAED